MYNNKSAYICLWMYIFDVTMMYLNSTPTSCNCSAYKIFPNMNREMSALNDELLKVQCCAKKKLTYARRCLTQGIVADITWMELCE